MTKPIRFAFFVVSLIVTLIIFGNWVTSAQATSAGIDATPMPTPTP